MLGKFFVLCFVLYGFFNLVLLGYLILLRVLFGFLGVDSCREVEGSREGG